MLGHLIVQTKYGEDLTSLNTYVNHHHRVASSQPTREFTVWGCIPICCYIPAFFLPFQRSEEVKDFPRRSVTVY